MKVIGHTRAIDQETYAFNHMTRYHFDNCTGKRVRKIFGRLPKEVK